MARKVDFVKPVLEPLTLRVSDQKKLTSLHRHLKGRFPFVDRVAVALYDSKTGIAKTFLRSEDRPTDLRRYEAPLGEAASLKKVFQTQKIRVVNDLSVFDRGRGQHTQAVRAGGFRSSATFPLTLSDRVIGFIFFNSRRSSVFSKPVLSGLEIYAHLIGGVATEGVRAARLLRASLKTAGDMVHFRDPETGNHLERMSRFSRLIAQELSRSGRHKFNDERIEYIEHFAPLHDVGKLGIPDRILLKNRGLTPSEWKVMRTHTTQGRRIIDTIVRNFGLTTFERLDTLRHIAEHHHETMDGRGYPHGLRGKKIPIEARIIAVADIFDALTSERPYKTAWSNDRAFKALEKLSRNKLDRDCVRALMAARAEAEAIQKKFRDPPGGFNGASARAPSVFRRR